MVAVKGGAVPEVLGEAGILTPANDPEAFSARVQELLADPELRASLGAAARHRATEHFSLSAMQRAYADAVESVCPADQTESTMENVEPAAPRL